MNKIKTLFLKILQNKITYNDSIVPVVIKDHWNDITPCITIYGFNRDRHDYPRQQITIKKELSKNHLLYDKNNPRKKYPHLAEMTRHSYEIQLNIWCNDERERELITDQVKNCLFLARNSHHKYCTKYDKKTKMCKTIDEKCKALTDKGYHGLRGTCPRPKEYKCCNIFKAYGVLKNTITISDDYDMDEYDHKPPLKRTIIEVNMDYNELMIYPSNLQLCYDIDMK